MASKAKGSRSRKRPRDDDDSPQLLETTLCSQDAVRTSKKKTMFIYDMVILGITPNPH